MGQERPLVRKQIFSKLPDERAGVDQWREWACEAKEWAVSLSNGEKKRRGQLAKLRKELKVKNEAFVRYKKEISELQERVAEYEDSFLFQFRAFIRRLVGKRESE